MKAGSRPQYYRIRRMVQMVREGAETGDLPNSSDFMKEFEVSRRTVARDLDFLRDEERAPLAYDDAHHGFRLTDETYTLPPVRISRKEAFSFGLARKLLVHYEGIISGSGFFALTANIPKPMTIMLFGLGLLTTAFRRRTRVRQ
jgi:predicted DNA-binding transcriptional regulator YafY